MVSILALIVAACGSGASSSSSSSKAQAPAAATPITIGVAAPVASMALPTLALQAGLFAKQKIDATVRYLPASELLTAISGGTLDYGVFASPQPEEGALQGAALKWIAQWTVHPDFQFLGGPGITSFKDLVGKPVGFTTAGSTTQILTDVALANHGVKPSSVTSVPLTSPVSQNDAFISGEIDAILQAPPLSNLALAKRKGSTILYNFATGSFLWPFAGLVANMTYANAHDAVTVGLLKALGSALTLWSSSPSQARAAIAAFTSTSVPAELSESYSSTSKAFSNSLVPSVAAEKVVLQTISSTQPKAKTANPAFFIDTSFLNQAGLG
jgi:ABC-type nitrate/sulfonate/bicarbonate transport system substrate-binding protein